MCDKFVRNGWPAGRVPKHSSHPRLNVRKKFKIENNLTPGRKVREANQEVIFAPWRLGVRLPISLLWHTLEISNSGGSKPTSFLGLLACQLSSP